MNNPFGVEGYKTIGYEIVEQLGEAPAAVLFPCARGNGLYGAWKGFREARAWGWSRGLPAMVACQPEGANSLEVSLAQGAAEPVELPPVRSLAFSAAETVASGHAFSAIRESAGAACSASEDDIAQATRALAREGLLVETTSALTVACLPRLIASGRMRPDAPIVCVLRATGLRSAFPGELLGARIEVGPDPRALDASLARL